MADEIDPRYAPQFQRGFDPTQHVAPPTRSGPVRLAGGSPASAPRVSDPPRVVERITEGLDAKDAELSVDNFDKQVPFARSRLEWAVLVAGGVLLMLAGALFVGAVELSERYSGWLPGFEGQLYGAATESLPGPLLVGGVLAIVAWIVLRAVSAGRRAP